MVDDVTVVDAHVHIHPGTDVLALLEAATLNLSRVAAGLGAQRSGNVLMLAEMRGVGRFEAMQRGGIQLGRWSFESVAGDTAALVANASSERLTIIAGRQIVTVEGIEVLALATREKIEDGMTLAETLSIATIHEALVVLPWGAGKWVGARGRLVLDAINAEVHRLFIGDNGGRPRFWPEPAAFAMAIAKGRPILPGTDPLPLRREEARVGTFGFWLRGIPDAASPSRWLRERLLNATPDTVVRFGQLQGWLQFLKNQVELRIRKRRVQRHTIS